MFEAAACRPQPPEGLGRATSGARVGGGGGGGMPRTWVQAEALLIDAPPPSSPSPTWGEGRTLLPLPASMGQQPCGVLGPGRRRGPRSHARLARRCQRRAAGRRAGMAAGDGESAPAAAAALSGVAPLWMGIGERGGVGRGGAAIGGGALPRGLTRC